MEPNRVLQAAVFLRVRRWTDWALLLGAHVLHGLCVRALTSGPILAKWANAWQQTWWIAALGLLLGIAEDLCVCTCALACYWLIDKRCNSSSTNSSSSSNGAANGAKSAPGGPRGDALPVVDEAVSPSSSSSSASLTQSTSQSQLRAWLAEISPLTLRFIGYTLVFLASNACFFADGVLVRTRQMRFSTAFVRMYFHEIDAAAELQIDDQELWILCQNAMITGVFAIIVGYVGAVWINLTEWDFLRALHRFRVRQQYVRLQQTSSADNDDYHKNEAQQQQPLQPPARPLLLRKCCDRMSTRTLLLVLLVSLFTATILLSRLVPSIVAVIALNSSLNEPLRLLTGVELFSIRHTIVTKRMKDFVEHETEDAAMFSDDSLYRRTRSFHGPLAFNVSVKPGEQLNVLVLVIESFRMRDSQYLVQQDDQDSQSHPLLPPNMTLTPNFDRWASQGVAFRNMWSSWRTSRALETILFGQVPYDSITSTGTTNGKEEVALAGLPQFFHTKGYECVFTTGTRTDYEDWDTFLPAHGFDHVFDMWDLADIASDEIGIDYTNGDQMMTYWGIHDHLSFDVLGYLLQKRHHEQKNNTVSKVRANSTISTDTGSSVEDGGLDLNLELELGLQDPKEQEQEQEPEEPEEHKSSKLNTKKPWFVTHFTISSHVPFDERPDWYHRYGHNIPDFSDFYKGKGEHEELLKNYAEMRYYTDLTFGHFMDNLKASGVLNDTIVFVVGDHGQAPERGSATPEQDQMSATRVAGALIAEGRLGDSAGLIFEDVASHSDLLNTIADIVGVPQDGFLQSGVGHSLKRAVPFGKRVVHANNPAVNMAAVQGHTRMQYYSEVSDAVQAYHTEFDLLQQHDLMGKLSKERVKQIFEICAEGRMVSEYFKYRWDHACILAPTC